MQESWCELKKKKDFARRSFPQNSPSSVWLDVMFAALSAVSRLSDSATEEGGGNSSSQLHKRRPFSGGRPSPVVTAAALQIHGALNVELSAQSATFSRVFLQLGWVFFFAPSLVFCQSHAKQRPSQASLCLGANEPALRYCCSDADNGGGCQCCPSASEAQTGPSARIQSLKNFVHPLDDYVNCVILVSI